MNSRLSKQNSQVKHKRPQKNTKMPKAQTATKAVAKSSRPPVFYLGGTNDGQPPVLSPELYDNFDESNLHVHEVVKNEFTVGKSKITSCKSEWYYKDPKTGAAKMFYFFGPDATCFAPSYQYPLSNDDAKSGKGKGKAKEDEAEEKKDPSARKGVQIGYPLSTLNTAEEPTELEAAFMRFLDRLRHRAVEIAIAEVKKKGTKIPQVSKSLILASMSPQEDEDEEEAEARKLGCVKPVYTPARSVDGKVKPPAWYVPLVTSGKGEELKCSTKFYDPSDDPSSARAHNPLEYTKDKGEGSARGELGYPLFFLKENFWGQHGVDSAAGLSLKFFLVQADWAEVEAGANTYVPEERNFSGGIEKYRPIGRDESEFPSESDSEEDVKPKAKAKGKTKKQASESEESSEEVKPKAKPKAKSKAREVESEEESSEEVEVKPKSKAKSKKQAVESEESSEEVKVKPKAKGKSRIVESEEESSEEVKVKSKAKPKAKAKSKKQAAESDEESE